MVIRASVISVVALILAVGCGDPSGDGTADASNIDNAADAGTNDASQADDTGSQLLECADDEFTFEDGCMARGLILDVTVFDDSLDQISARPYPEFSGGDAGTTQKITVTDQCYIERVEGQIDPTPTGLGCFDAGTLALSQGSTRYDIPWDAEECYKRRRRAVGGS